MELVTVQTFDNAIDAHMLKTKLKNENIQCFLFDEHMVGLNPLYNITVGGIKLKIHPSDVQKARNIIEELSNAPLENEDGNVVTCPHCQSTEIYSGFKSMKGKKGLLSAIISFLLFVFPIYYKTVYRCKSCDTEFE